jgi:hypothetical protein
MADYLKYVGILGAVLGATAMAKTAEAGDVYWLNVGNGYAEECLHEGCAKEERNELYFAGDYDEECIGEGCSVHEKIELACSQNPLAFCGNSEHQVMQLMQNHFCSDGRRVLCSDATGSSFNRNCVICN